MITRMVSRLTVSVLVAASAVAALGGTAAADDGGTTTLSGYVARYPAIRYNSAGGINTITPTGNGTFLIRFPRLAAAGGVVLVTPYRPAGDLNCQPRYWHPSGADEIVVVGCTTRSGPADDANFSVLFSRPARNSTGPYAYLWADRPSGGCYAPSTPYQMNSTGAANQVCRAERGRWTVTLPGLGGWTTAGGGGHIQVNSYGSLNARCGVERWYIDQTSALRATVTCSTPTGAPVDTNFTLLFANGVSLFGHNRFVRPGALGAGYLWASRPSVPGTYQTTGYSWNAAGGPNTVTRLGAGRYRAHFPGIVVLGGVSAVTTYGPTTSHCTVGASESGYVHVNCHSTAGAPIDSNFTVAYLNAGQT